MHRKFTFTAALLASVCGGALMAPAAWAQEGPTPVGELLVTAQKTEQSLQDVPISVKVLTGETLETIQADGLEDIVRLVPSLSMTNLSRGGNQVQIRGLGSNVASVGTVAIYNDGAISPSRIQSTGTFGERDAGLFDVERIEVLRGPQGTLYGEGSLGGVINIISRKPNAEVMQAAFSGAVSSTDGAGDMSSDLQAMVNLPVVKDVFALRGVFYRYDQAGYIDAVNLLPVFFANPAELAGADANTAEITGGRVMARFTPAGPFDGMLIWKTEHTEQGINNTTSSHLVATYGGPDFDAEHSQALFSGDYGSETDVDEVILEMNLDTALGVLTSITAWGSQDTESSSTAIFNADSWSEELRLASANDGPLNWITGFYYRDASRDIDFSGAPFRRETLQQWSVFGQAYWTFSPGLTATVGLRYEEQEMEVEDALNGLPAETVTFDSVIPKFNLAWEVSDEVMLYATAAKGFRAGGANSDESLGTDPNFSSGFEPDSIWNYEVGAKTEFMDGRAALNVSVFYIDWTDIQIDKAITSLINPPTQFIVVNGADAHSVGIEADLFLRPTPQWDIVLGGSLLEAEYDNGTIDSATLGPNIPLSGYTLPSTPKYILNASVEKRFATMSAMEPYLRADYSVRGSSYGDVPNTPPPGGDFSSGASQILNLRGGLRADTWEVQLFVENAANTEASTYTFYDGGFADLNVMLRPRTIGVNLKLRYN